ncbi:MAG TPA: tetratricopeptide repeat protein [Pyrinomonadaceae bacterium]|nr:tetratricopeptide repeat protein [Pyrinomonadaceae bacterium]
MKAFARSRVVLMLTAAGLAVFPYALTAIAQDVGGDIGGAVIFRPKNPETKKRTPKPSTVVKPGNRSTTSRTTRSGPSVADRVEDLLDKGNSFRDARRFAEAEATYKSVFQLIPTDGRAAYGLGNVYSDQQRWEDAEKSYRNAVQWSPKNVDALIALSVVLVQPRTGGDNARRFADAENAARRAVQFEPNNAVASDRLGVALQSRGLFNDETEHAYRRAVELDPNFAVAYAHLARVLKRSGRSDEAAPLYSRATELAKDPATLNLIAESLQAEQQWDSSQPVLKTALQIDARNPTSNFLMGRTLIVAKRYQEAEPYLKTATEVSPRAFQPFNLLGRAYLALDRYADAEVIYERAADLASAGDRRQLGGTFGFEGVGDGYMKIDQKENAARAYRRALQLDPENKGLEQKLSRARSR